MPVTRTRRIMRRAVWTLAACVLLSSAYISIWLAVSRAVNAGVIRPQTAQRIRPLFGPLLSYCASEHAGGGAIRECWWTVTVGDNQRGALSNPLSPSTPEDSIKRLLEIRQTALDPPPWTLDPGPSYNPAGY